MPRIRAFFRLAEQDGLQAARLEYRGRTHTYAAPGGRGRTGRWWLAAGSALLFVAALLGLRLSGGRGDSPDSPALPPVESGTLLRLVLQERGVSELTEYLKRHRYVEVADDYGWTALHWAAFLDDRAKIRALHQAGASMRMASRRDWFLFPGGATPAEVLRRRRRAASPLAAPPQI
jgi:hypothetical protein